MKKEGQPFDLFSSIELITPESLPKPAEVKTTQVESKQKKNKNKTEAKKVDRE